MMRKFIMCDISTYLSGLLNTERPARSYTQGSAFWYTVGLAPLVQGWVGWVGTLVRGLFRAHSKIKVSATHILSSHPPPAHGRGNLLVHISMFISYRFLYVLRAITVGWVTVYSMLGLISTRALTLPNVATCYMTLENFIVMLSHNAMNDVFIYSCIDI
jgi:hypothetical protein